MIIIIYSGLSNTNKKTCNNTKLLKIINTFVKLKYVSDLFLIHKIKTLSCDFAILKIFVLQSKN